MMQNIKPPEVQVTCDGNHYRFYCDGCPQHCTLFESDIKSGLDSMLIANGVEQTRANLQRHLTAAESGDIVSAMTLSLVMAGEMNPLEI